MAQEAHKYYDKENFDTKIFSHRQCDDENLICVFFKKYLKIKTRLSTRIDRNAR